MARSTEKVTAVDVGVDVLLPGVGSVVFAPVELTVEVFTMGFAPP
jgi:hypothetical protein